MRQRISRHLIPLRIWCERRREHLDTYNWIFEDYPFHRRIWHRYLYWVLFFTKNAVSVYGRYAILQCVRYYCIAADVMLGGDRCRRFIKARQQEITQMGKHNTEIDKKWRKHRENAFALRLDKEAEENPRFAPSQKRTQ